MAVRQYIGARYVTKIYENSLDPSSAEWEAGVTYEPLTMVTYLNSSYLSKKTVPGSIGDPAANPSYWAVTGAYNGQILNLQNQIDRLNNDVIPPIRDRFQLSGRKFIVICDSYGNDLNTDNRNFYEQSFYELNHSDYYDFHRGSSGFSKTGSLNFLTVLTDNDSAITDKSEITDIIVCGGANDQDNINDIENGIYNFMTYVKANYPNANVYIGHFTNAIRALLGQQLRASINKYRELSVKYGAGYIQNSEYIMAKMSFFENADAVHPTETGNRALTKYFSQFLLTGNIDVYETAQGCFEAATADITIDYDRVYFMQHNGLINIGGIGAGGALKFTSSTPVSVAAGLNIINNLLKVKDGFFYSLIYNFPAINVTMGDRDDMFAGNIFAYNIEDYKISKIGFTTMTPTAKTVSTFFVNLGSFAYSIFDGYSPS